MQATKRRKLQMVKMSERSLFKIVTQIDLKLHSAWLSGFFTSSVLFVFFYMQKASILDVFIRTLHGPALLHTVPVFNTYCPLQFPAKSRPDVVVLFCDFHNFVLIQPSQRPSVFPSSMESTHHNATFLFNYPSLSEVPHSSSVGYMSKRITSSSLGQGHRTQLQLDIN